MENASTQTAVPQSERKLTIAQICRRLRVPYNVGYNAVLKSGRGDEDQRGKLTVPEKDVPAVAAAAGLPVPDLSVAA